MNVLPKALDSPPLMITPVNENIEKGKKIYHILSLSFYYSPRSLHGCSLLCLQSRAYGPGDTVGNLLNEIGKKVNKADKASVEDMDTGTSDDKWVTPNLVSEHFKANRYMIGEVSSFVGARSTTDGLTTIDDLLHPVNLYDHLDLFERIPFANKLTRHAVHTENCSDHSTDGYIAATTIGDGIPRQNSGTDLNHQLLMTRHCGSIGISASTVMSNDKIVRTIPSLSSIVSSVSSFPFNIGDKSCYFSSTVAQYDSSRTFTVVIDRLGSSITKTISSQGYNYYSVIGLSRVSETMVRLVVLATTGFNSPTSTWLYKMIEINILNPNNPSIIIKDINLAGRSVTYGVALNAIVINDLLWVESVGGINLNEPYGDPYSASAIPYNIRSFLNQSGRSKCIKVSSNLKCFASPSISGTEIYVLTVNSDGGVSRVNYSLANLDGASLVIQDFCIADNATIYISSLRNMTNEFDTHHSSWFSSGPYTGQGDLYMADYNLYKASVDTVVAELGSWSTKNVRYVTSTAYVPSAPSLGINVTSNNLAFNRKSYIFSPGSRDGGPMDGFYFSATSSLLTHIVSTAGHPSGIINHVRVYNGNSNASIPYIEPPSSLTTTTAYEIHRIALHYIPDTKNYITKDSVRFYINTR